MSTRWVALSVIPPPSGPRKRKVGSWGAAGGLRDSAGEVDLLNELVLGEFVRLPFEPDLSVAQDVHLVRRAEVVLDHADRGSRVARPPDVTRLAIASIRVGEIPVRGIVEEQPERSRRDPDREGSDDPGPPPMRRPRAAMQWRKTLTEGVEVVLLPEPDRGRSFRAIRTSLQPLGWHLGESGSDCKLRPGAITISGGKPSNLAVRNGTAPGPAAEKLRSGRNLETNPVPRRRPLKRPRRPGGRRGRRSARAVRSRRSRTRSPPRSAGSPRTGRARRSAPPGGARGSAGGTGRR